MVLYSTPPWLIGTGRVTIHPNLPGILSKHEDPAKILSAAYDRIIELNSQITIYTDGSAAGGMTMGGSAAVITRGDPINPEEIEVLKHKGAFYTCSFDEENDAVVLAMGWLEKNLPLTASIVTDSKSLCDGLKDIKPDLDSLRLRLRNYPNELTIQWVPGHCGIAGNELADKAANEAAEMEGSHSEISYKSICAKIRQITKDPPKTHELPKKVYNARSQKKEAELNCRRDEVLLQRLDPAKPGTLADSVCWDDGQGDKPN